ncbi:MAG: CBS domain-containing protein [Anaerolineales bacterium]|nr:CBS domain-containing protein [Anaerolineales bacterium]
MLVGKRMTRNPITTHSDTTVPEALNIMKVEKVRRLPVVDKNRLVGIVSDKDLLNASPSPATSLSVWEINYLLSKLTVKEVMNRNVITTTEDMVLENAARMMADNKIGCLPVVRGDNLVGIITETDLFKVFIELFGARVKGTRVTMLIPAVKGELAKITEKIAGQGGNILALGTFLGDDPSNALVTIKVEDIQQDKLVQMLEPLVVEITDVRET